MIAAWLRALWLALVIDAMPGVRTGDAVEFAIVAIELCEDPVLCAAIGWGESKFQRDPTGGNPAVWGAMQVNSKRPRVVTIRAGVAAGVVKLRSAVAHCHRRHRGPLCVCAVYAGGNRWRSPKAQRRALGVLRRAATINRAAYGSRTNQNTEGT